MYGFRKTISAAYMSFMNSMEEAWPATCLIAHRPANFPPIFVRNERKVRAVFRRAIPPGGEGAVFILDVIHQGGCSFHTLFDPSGRVQFSYVL